MRIIHEIESNNSKLFKKIKQTDVSTDWPINKLN